MALLLLHAAPADAAKKKQTGDLSHILTPPKINHNAPMLLQADQMVYDNAHNRVIAKGNVEIYYNNYTLLADQVIYDRNANTLQAQGNVSIKDPDGAVITSNQMTLTDDFRDAFAQSLKFVTKEDTRIVAQTATREAGNVTVFQNGWFTPCKPCVNHPERPPTWRIKAKQIVHDKDKATIVFKNAQFDLFGVPIAWSPYLKTADPTVKRKSGFLIPTFSTSGQLGTAVRIPYYFALGNSYDLTVVPLITAKAGTMLLGDWRQRLANGDYHIELAGVDNEGLDTGSDADFRGSIRTSGRFALDPMWSFGWDVLAESDDTFRRFYNLDDYLRTDRVSQIYLEGIHDRNYAALRLYNTAGLVDAGDPLDDELSKTYVLPEIDYDYYAPHPVLGGELNFTANVMALQRMDDNVPDQDHGVVEANWRRQMIDPIGEVFTPFAQLRGDVYNIDNNPDGPNGDLARGNAMIGGEYSYPFVAQTGNITHVIEPIAQIIVRPNSVGDQQEIPDEDANSLIFDDTILFDIDKFSGFDRTETGTTANAGLRYTAQLASGAYMRAVFGQSYHLAGENNFPEYSGLATDQSDYVGGLYIQATPYIGFSAQNRWDHDSWARERTDLGLHADYGPVGLAVNYADATHAAGIPDTAALNIGCQPGQHCEELRTSGSLALTDKWALLGDIRYDLVNDFNLQDGIGLRYSDDCFTLSVTYVKSNYEYLDIQPDQRVVAEFSLKYLGNYKFTTDAADLGEND